ncbi:MAG: glycosyltransferase [Actinomyces sp.]|uniref:glycosyltransferase n=1 Tax=Actinomyces sp. TaxID=29317 RepID=UPI0026DAC38A|nr:glycosyltransferase [Actinomyces sp.]MDO4242222.1 glycosyltransferase [Actinomyces sp.]
MSALPPQATAPQDRPAGPSTTARTDLGRPEPGGAVVDVVIACHNPARPVGRAVASVLEGNPQACVTVVCHNRRAEEIAQVIDPVHRGRVRYLEHRDPRPSASGPFNAGIRAARTPWVSIMGSDDSLAPGAVASWLRLARATGAEFIVPRLALGTPRTIVPTPAARPTRLLGPTLAGLGPRRSAVPRPLVLRLALIGRGLSTASLVADRLSYRSAPLGLMSVAMLAREDLWLVEGATVGGDVAMVTRMFATVPTAYDARGPVYLIGEDASDRVTYVVRPIAEQLGFLDELLDQDWARALDLRSRRAVAAKMARIHLFGAVHYRPDASTWTPQERADLAACAAHLEAFAPGYATVLSVAETALLRACLDPQVPASELISRSAARRRHGRPSTLLTGSPLTILSREAPLRLMGASVLTKMVPADSRS